MIGFFTSSRQMMVFASIHVSGNISSANKAGKTHAHSIPSRTETYKRYTCTCQVVTGPGKCSGSPQPELYVVVLAPPPSSKYLQLLLCCCLPSTCTYDRHCDCPHMADQHPQKAAARLGDSCTALTENRPATAMCRDTERVDVLRPKHIHNASIFFQPYILVMPEISQSFAFRTAYQARHLFLHQRAPMPGCPTSICQKSCSC